MKVFLLTRAVWLALLAITLELAPQTAAAAPRQIILPPGSGGVVGNGIAFAHGSAVGVVLVGALGAPLRLLSFIPSNAAIADDLVLEDFPPSLPSSLSAGGMVVNNGAGLVVIFGNAGNETQTAVGIAVDVAGNLEKKWAISRPNPFGGKAEAVTNADGSSVYFFYNDASPKLDKIRADDGSLLGTIQLDDFDIEAGLTFNNVQKRLIIKTGFFFHVLNPEDDAFGVDWRITSPADLAGVRQLYVSEDGRFLIGYAGYLFPPNANLFMTLNMESREIRSLAVKNKMLPSGIALTFLPRTATLIVPYSSTVKVKNGRLSVCTCGTQVADWLVLNQDGTLSKSFTTQLTSDDQIIGPLNNVALSKTSAIAFLATMTKHLVAIDTITGEVLSDQDVGDIFFIHRIGDTDIFLTANGTNVLTLLELKSGPSIDEIRVRKKKLIIEGQNFLSGVRVQINGQNIADISRSPDSPSRKLIVKIGKGDSSEGQALEVVVVNRDGLSSDPFTVRR